MVLTSAPLTYIVGHMASEPSLGEFEQIVLLAVLRLQGAAYGVSIRAEIVERTSRECAAGALYTTLDRLEHKGLLTSRTGDPTPQRGGRAKRYYTVTAPGVAAVTRAQRAFHNLLKGLKLPGGSLA
jgi:PadR family transcriptional regulator